MSTVLVAGATGSIGRLVVEEALDEGYAVRALVRDPAKAALVLPPAADIAVGDVTRPPTLPAAVDGVDALILTLGSDAGGSSPEDVDYGGVRNLLEALAGRRIRVVLMTAIGDTSRSSGYGHLLDWKRRSERLVRASGLPYTIVRPGWFDYTSPDDLRLVALQGDTRRSGTPADGAVSRRQIAQVLVHALSSGAAVGKTFELVAEKGPSTEDFDEFFGPLAPDPFGSLDGVRDEANMPLAQEPERVRADLAAVGAA